MSSPAKPTQEDSIAALALGLSEVIEGCAKLAQVVAAQEIAIVSNSAKLLELEARVEQASQALVQVQCQVFEGAEQQYRAHWRKEGAEGSGEGGMKN